MSSETLGGGRMDSPLSMEAVASDVSLSDLLADLALLLTTPEQREAHRLVAEACEQLPQEPSEIAIVNQSGDKIAVITGSDADEIIEIAIEQFIMQALRGHLGPPQL